MHVWRFGAVMVKKCVIPILNRNNKLRGGYENFLENNRINQLMV